MIIQFVSEVAIVSGITAAISVFIGLFFGLIVLIKSIKTKQFLIFNFFLCIVFTLSPWFPSGLGLYIGKLRERLYPIKFMCS